MNGLFLSWSKRNILMLGKAQIIKTLIMPILLSFLVHMCYTGKNKKDIEIKCFKFIWNGKPDKVKRNTLIGDFEKGWLKMIDIESYFISLIPLEYLNALGKNYLFFYMNIGVKKHNQFLNNILNFTKMF